MPKLPTRLNDLDVSAVFKPATLSRYTDLDALVSARADATKAAASRETLRAYQSDWRKWLSWCNERCLELDSYPRSHLHPRRQPLPADPRTIRDFIKYYSLPMLTKDGELDDRDRGQPKAVRQLTPATMTRIVSSIGKAHTLLGLPNPCTDDIVTKTLKSYRTRRGRQRHAGQILWEDIAEFLDQEMPVEAALPSTPENAAFKAELPDELKTEAHWLRARLLLTLAYSTMLRREELIRICFEDFGQADADGSCILLVPYVKGGRDDVRFVSTIAYRCLEQWRAHTQLEKGPVFCKIQKTGEARLRTRVRIKRKKADGTLTDYYRYSKPPTFENYGKRMSAAEVNLIFKASMRAIGKKEATVSRISGHSCRRGATKDLSDAGYTTQQIMEVAGWQTPTMPARYLRDSNPSRSAMASLSRQQSDACDLKKD